MLLRPWHGGRGVGAAAVQTPRRSTVIPRDWPGHIIPLASHFTMVSTREFEMEECVPRRNEIFHSHGNSPIVTFFLIGACNRCDVILLHTISISRPTIRTRSSHGPPSRAVPAGASPAARRGSADPASADRPGPPHARQTSVSTGGPGHPSPRRRPPPPSPRVPSPRARVRRRNPRYARGPLPPPFPHLARARIPIASPRRIN